MTISNRRTKNIAPFELIAKQTTRSVELLTATGVGSSICFVSIWIKKTKSETKSKLNRNKIETKAKLKRNKVDK